MFDEGASARPSTAQNPYSMSLEGGSQVADDGALAKQTFEDALSRVVGGGATSAAGGAASPDRNRSISVTRTTNPSLTDG